MTDHGVDTEGDEQEVAEYFWVEMPHADIRVRIPILGKTTSKQVRVDVKRNWLTIWAPAPESIVGYNPVDRPPKEPLLDFQLYGAVDPDECDWEVCAMSKPGTWRAHGSTFASHKHLHKRPTLRDLNASQLVDDGAVRNIILTLVRSPVYKWPTLHRVNGLKRESDRPAALARQKAEFTEQQRMQAQAQKNQATAEYEEVAGPKKPPQFGPAPRAPRRPHRPKDEHGKPLPPVGRPPGSYERGRIIVTAPEYTDSSDDD